MVLTEAAVTQMCAQIRALYIVILLFCQPSNPSKLFDDFWQDWTDDFKRQGEKRGYTYTEEQLKTMVRLDLQVCICYLNNIIQHYIRFDCSPMNKTFLTLVLNQ